MDRDIRRAGAVRPGWMVPAVCAVALLHFGRPVLEPLAVAGILTLTLAPLVRRMRELGLPHAAAAFVSVGMVAACVLAAGAIIATQLADVVRELPQYRAAVASKLDQVSAFVELPAHPATGATLSRLFTLVWGPAGEAVIVLVLLLFMLLARDSIRERVIRLTGESEVAHTMQALADTDQGVSRFFASLAVVNTAFAAVSSIALASIGVPHAVLWGALVGAMRFVPYVGVPAAIAVVAAFAAAVDPGWSLALWSVATLVSLDAVLANVIEPKVYGHTMGIAPFGIIVAALFWGALWGPVGLIVSAPLTLCLVVAGRHVQALAPLAIMLGESPGSTRALLLYQRALAGESQDVLDDARAYVRRHGLARYCDDVLLPALAIGGVDMRAGRIDRRQDRSVRALLVSLVEALRGARTRRGGHSLVEASVGTQLRRMREARLGPWQGSLDVPARSVVLCAGLANERDELLTELLVRSLCHAHLDARSVVMHPEASDPEGEKAGLVSLVLVTYPAEAALPEWRETCRSLRCKLPHATIAAIKPPDGIHARVAGEREVRQHVDIVLHSFSEALSFAARPRERVALAPAHAIPEQAP